MLPSLAHILQHFQNRRPIRAGSLITTVLGDAIVPHGSEVWLGSLIKALEPFGLNPRLTRTAVFRLTQDHWLTANPIGRRSYYEVTDFGQRHFKQAFKLIYAHQSPPWDGTWTLVLMGQLENDERKQLKQGLQWLGYGQACPQTMLHPTAEHEDLDALLEELQLTGKVLVLDQAVPANPLSVSTTEQVRSYWDFSALSHSYQEFLSLFTPLLTAAKQQALSPQEAFMARTLLIHDYRRILLRDPLLPDELVGPNWPGHDARQLAKDLYQQLWAAAEVYITSAFETAAGEIPAASDHFHQRFGGLA
jgi:phenylacetic acid degradation operon negative regulatory protein